MTAATMKINSTLPAAFASAHSASSASGSSTSWTQRGTTTRGGCSGGCGLAGVGQRPLLLRWAEPRRGALSETPLTCRRNHRQSMAEPEAAVAAAAERA